MTNSRKGVSGIGGDRSEVRDGAGSPLSFDGGASSRWWLSGITSCSYNGSTTSSFSSLDQEALGRCWHSKMSISCTNMSIKCLE
jgi:hypothetical protein